MNRRNRLLTAILLLLIGVLTGAFFVMMQERPVDDRSAVSVTELTRSEQPQFSDEELEKLDARFLFKNVADRVTPAVVYISTLVNVDNADDEGNGSFWDEFRSSRRARAVGSGVIIAENGYIVTNNHVIEGAVNGGIRVMLPNKREFEARVVGSDPTTDLAVIKIDARGLRAMTIANSDALAVGEWVLAIGNPFRLRSTVTAGIVSALSRQVQIPGSEQNALHIESFIQTDAAINKGNSGGALVNTSGELVGINTAIASKTGSYQGYGFAVPSNLVQKVVGDVIEYGRVRRALLGVSIVAVDDERARSLGLDAIRGVEVAAVSEDGAADQQNIQRGDVILNVNGQPVNEPNQLQEKIALQQPGSSVDLTLWRRGRTVQKTIRLNEVEPSTALFQAENKNVESPRFSDEQRQGLAFASFSLGFSVVALSTPEDPEIYDLIIDEVKPDSEAARKGLSHGQTIRAVDGTPVQTLPELRQTLRKAKNENGKALLKVLSPKGAPTHLLLTF